MNVAEIIRKSLGVLFIAATSVVFSISFAAIIYSGSLSGYLSQGIGITLLGGTVMMLIACFALSSRGTVVQAQDVPAILLSGSAAVIAAQYQMPGDALFATIVCLVAVTALCTGLVALVLGRLRLAYIARYIPYPVLAGFLATTGLLLFLGGIGVAVGTTPDIHNFTEFFTAPTLLKWVPAVIAALAIAVATRRISGILTLPLALLATTVGFFVLIEALGLSGDEARASGLLLGPFQNGSFLTGLDLSLLREANWTAIIAQLPVILSIVAISLIGTTLNASGLELELGEDLDINAEMSGVGLGNVFGAAFGAIPGYHLLGETLLARRLGLVNALAGLSAAAGSLAVLLFGGAVLSNLPVGLFATVVIFLGADLIYTWLWQERKRLSLLDYSVVVLIPAIAILFGFLTAIAAGLIAAIGIFVLAYAKLDVMRSQTTAASRRSFVERPDNELEILSQTGQHAQIIELSGYLFFGSANIVRENIDAILSENQTDLKWVILDFRHVSGMDISTWHVLQRIDGNCATQNVTLLFSGLDIRHLRAVGGTAKLRQDQNFATLDQAIEHVEDALLAQHDDGLTPTEANFLDRLKGLFSADDFARFFRQSSVDAGTVIIERHSESKEMFFLEGGQLSVRITNPQGLTSTVAQIRSGAVFGEMAFYSERPRSADIVADKASEILSIDEDSLSDLEAKDPNLAAAFHKLIANHMARRLTRTTTLLSDIGI